MQTLTPGEKINIIKSTTLPAILYGLEFTKTLKRSNEHCNEINSAIAKACKIALGVPKDHLEHKNIDGSRDQAHRNLDRR